MMPINIYVPIMEGNLTIPISVPPDDHLIIFTNFPKILKMQGKKPWEVCHYDTMELWKFGDYKSFTSLKLLAKHLAYRRQR